MNIQDLKKYLEIEARYKRRIAELEDEMLEMVNQKEFKRLVNEMFRQSEGEKQLDMIFSYEEECMKLIDSYIIWILAYLKRRKKQLGGL